MAKLSRLFSREYIERGLSGKYLIEGDIKVSFLAKIIESSQYLTIPILSLPCKIPILDQIFESISRCWSISTFGYLLRSIYYKDKLGDIGLDTFINPGVFIENPKNVFLGRNSFLGRGVSIKALEGLFRLGNYSEIDLFSFIHAGGNVEIGSYSAVSAYSCIYSVTHLNTLNNSPSTRAPASMQGFLRKKVSIGNFTHIGAGSIILPGVNIGNNVTIGAHSLVNTDIPDGKTAVGNPIKILEGD